MLLDLLVQALFDFQVLDDRFDDQVAVFQTRQIVIEVPDAHQRSEVAGEEGGGPGFLCGFQSGAGDAVANFLRFQRQSFGLLIRGQFARDDVE